MEISRWIDHAAAWDGDKAALHVDGEDITYAALAQRVARLAGALHERGVGEGDRVAHLGRNGPEILELLFACARLGAALVPLNWRLARPEYAFILGDSAPRLLFVEEPFDDVAAAAEGEFGLGCIALGRPRRGWPGFRDATAAADPIAAAVADRGAATALIVYTSGTTGRPKGAMLPQSALFWNAVNATLTLGMSRDDHVLTAIPMFHVGGLNIQTTPALHLGATVTIARRFDPRAALALIAERRPTLFIAVPAMMRALIDHPDWPDADLSSLRLFTTGSSPIPLPLLRAWLDRGIPVTQVYGLTESGPVSTVTPAAEAERKLGSCGRPAPYCEARVVDAGGNDVGADIRGEILLRGPGLATGYWNDAQATEEAFAAGGWLRTGDIGHWDEEGCLYVDDRAKDVIISGGENIYPAELEEVLAGCPGIAEAAVVGRPDRSWGEVPVAVVVPREAGSCDKQAVIDLFEGALARFKHPKDVVFVDALPRNSMGKVLKFELRERIAATAGATGAVEGGRA